jgi:hypothetical protein
MNIQDLAGKVTRNLVDKQGVKKETAFDPTIIMVIAQAIQMVFQGLKDCNIFPPAPTPTPTPTPAPATQILNNPNVMHRFLLRCYIAKTGVNRAIRTQVYNAMLDTGKTLKNADLISIGEDLNFDLV